MSPEEELELALALSASEMDARRDKKTSSKSQPPRLGSLGRAHTQHGASSSGALRQLDPSTRQNSSALSTKQNSVDTSRDEAIARALQEEEMGRASTSQSQVRGQHNLITPDTKCAACSNPLGTGRFMKHPVSLRPLHPSCFKCVICDKPIAGQFCVSRESENAFLHPDCARQAYLPQCRVCGKHIERASVHPYWKDTYCPKHDSDGTPKCDSCQRIRSGEDPAMHRVDRGRVVCDTCAGTMVVDTADAQPLYKDVFQFFRSRGLVLPTEPPLALVEEEALNEGMRNKRQGHSRGHCRGMTFVEVAQRYVSRRGGPAVQDGAPEVQVNAIMVLKGYPRILTGEIIAHEVMHAWLKSRRVLSLRPEVEEGLCELMAHLWLESHGSAPADGHESALRKFLLWAQENNPDPAYGGGFRKARAAYRKYGLQRVLDHVAATADFPL